MAKSKWISVAHKNVAGSDKHTVSSGTGRKWKQTYSKTFIAAKKKAVSLAKKRGVSKVMVQNSTGRKKFVVVKKRK